ncbi:MAG: Clp protease N-terminal domain-containing protein [Gemmatimonadaceae bacterium]
MQGFNFTTHVRKVLAMAREEAVRLHHPYVGTEHILLALTRADEESVATAVLRNLRIDPEGIRQKIDDTIKIGKAEQPSDLPYTSRAKKVLELAMSEARELHHSYVGTEHLLLGLLREEKGIGAQVLAYHGLTRDEARAEVVRHPTVGARAGGIDATNRKRSGAGPITGKEERVAQAVSMASRSQFAAVAFWMTLALVVLIDSVRPIVAVLAGVEQFDRQVVVLASIEIVGALLFLVPKTLRYGAWILLAVFAVAIVAHLAKGEFPAPLFVYAAGTYFVLVQKQAKRPRSLGSHS